MVVLCVAVLVSNDTMILVGSRELLGAGDTKMAPKGDWGGVGRMLEGRGGTGGKSSRGDLFLRKGDVARMGASSDRRSGIEGRDGGGLLGGGKWYVTGATGLWSSIVSTSSDSSSGWST